MPNLTTVATWQSNATQAEESDDQIDTLQLNADLLASERYAFGRDDALHLTLHAAGDWWPRYDQLFTVAGGGRAEWRHQFGPSPLAPIVSIEGAADAVAAEETGRRGVSSAVTLRARKRLNHATRLSAWHEAGWYFARYGVYDRASNETALELDRDLNRATRFTFTLKYRTGDIVSYAAGSRPDLEAIAESQREVTTFDRAMTAYRVDAKTWSGRLALVRAVDDASAIVLAYERRESEHKTLRVSNDLLSVGFVHQF